MVFLRIYDYIFTYFGLNWIKLIMSVNRICLYESMFYFFLVALLHYRCLFVFDYYLLFLCRTSHCLLNLINDVLTYNDLVYQVLNYYRYVKICIKNFKTRLFMDEVVQEHSYFIFWAKIWCFVDILIIVF